MNRIFKQHIPIFITTDTILHLWHLMFDKVLKQAELTIYYPLLADLVLKMIDVLTQELGQDDLDLASQHTMLYLYTAALLVDKTYSVPEEFTNHAQTLYQAILHEISVDEAMAEYTGQPLIRFVDEFSLYRPRGHYDGNVYLESYFRLFKWLSRIPFFFDEYLGSYRIQTLPADMVKSSIQLAYAMNQ